MTYEEWPDCPILGCTNKTCLRLGSKYCWPHTPGSPEEAMKSVRLESVNREIQKAYAEATAV